MSIINVENSFNQFFMKEQNQNNSIYLKLK